MDWPLVFLRSFVVVSLGGCRTIGRADLAHTNGASDINFLGKLKPLIKLDQKLASLGGCLTIGRAELAHTDGALDVIFLGKLKPLTKLDQKFASLGGVLTIGLADLAHMDGASDFIFPETYPATTSEIMNSDSF